jgi:hypothetical protein
MEGRQASLFILKMKVMFLLPQLSLLATSPGATAPKLCSNTCVLARKALVTAV